MSSNQPEAYIIRGGEKGRARLGVLSRILAPTTGQLLDRAGPMDGAQIIDLGCGGGDVTRELARRAGPKGHVWGFDLDAKVIELARAEARNAAHNNVTFEQANIAEDWPVRNASLIYARFILADLPNPAAVLARAWETLMPGGRIVVEDIDMEGRFWDPPSPAFARMTELYMKAARQRGCDPAIGRKLGGLLERSDFEIVQSTLVQPFGRDGDVKELARLDCANITDAIVRQNLISRAEADAIANEIDAYAQRVDTTISLPRVFQVVARKK